jgi:hypothetical protein
VTVRERGRETFATWLKMLPKRLDPVTAVAALVLAFGAVQLAAGALEAGVTLDEPLHVERAESWLRDGWYVPEGQLVEGRPAPGDPAATPYVYGPAFEAVAHVANFVAGNESIGGISRSADAYAVRHLTVAALALLTVAVAGAAVSFLTRSRRFGIWAAAGLLAIPEWTGQGFFNPKDIPTATGYTLLTVALALALGQAGEPQSRRRRWAIGALAAGGVLIGVGTRMALWVPFTASLASYTALRYGQRRLGGRTGGGETDLAVAAGAGAGVVAVAALYPNAVRAPVSLLVESVSGSADFAWKGVTLTAGQLLSQNPPWWYLPTWIWASLPLLLGALALLGAVLGIRALALARGTGWRGALWGRRDLGLVLVLQQALLLPVVSVLGGAVMYSGMRQHIYVLPAIAILAGVGAQRLWRWAAAKGAAEWRRDLATAVLVVALLVPILEQALLFPYDYTYVNPLAGIGGVNGNWETDYWVASAPEALSHVPRGVELRCFLVMPAVPCEEDELAPFEGKRGTDVKPRWRTDTSATWAIVRRHAGNVPPSYCERADDVTRWLRGERVVMSYVLRCDPARLAAAE